MEAKLLPIGILAAIFCGTPCFAQSPSPLTPRSGPPVAGSIILPGANSAAGVVVTDSSYYVAGQPVHVKFTISNRTNNLVRYNFSTAQLFDVSVLDSTGAEVWRWSHGRTFRNHFEILSLNPGQSKVFTVSWNGRDNAGNQAPPGTYTISAHTTSNDRPAITGSLIVNTETDPNNMGMPTRDNVDNGAIRQVNVRPPITATTKITISE